MDEDSEIEEINLDEVFPDMSIEEIIELKELEQYFKDE